MSEEYFAWIKQDFSLKVTYRSMSEGEIVFANEPILSYTGPIGFIQLL
jgi:nicotinic acid phosphoribosyltransferase